MINIEFLGQTSVVSLTLSEKSICIDQPSYWVFEIRAQQTGQTAIFTAPDIAFNTGIRYNQFVWQSVSQPNEDLLDGKFYVWQAGTYNYRAYQFSQLTYPSLDLTDSIKLVEVGLMRLKTSGELDAYQGLQSTIPSFT